MEDNLVTSNEDPARRTPWNKGKLIGAKPPLRPSHGWSIKTRLQIEGRKRDLALVNLAIDSKLRGCDAVAVRVACASSKRGRPRTPDALYRQPTSTDM